MKGIILAGGTGSRLDPLTRVTNKHLLPVYDRPMIYFPIQTLAEAGVRDIMIVSGKGHAGHFLELLRSGSDFGVHFSYGVQERAGGIAEALALGENFADHGPIVVILGDNIIEDSISSALRQYERQQRGAKIFLKRVPNPSSFGVPEIVKGKVTRIIEKPTSPPTDFAVTGLYLYDQQVWNVIRSLQPSDRGELEITDVNNFYAEQGTMTFQELSGWWGDGGESFDSLLRAAQLVAGRRQHGSMPGQT